MRMNHGETLFLLVKHKQKKTSDLLAYTDPTQCNPCAMFTANRSVKLSIGLARSDYEHKNAEKTKAHSTLLSALLTCRH